MFGSAPFQSLYEAAPGVLHSLLLAPDWWLVVAALAVLSMLGLAWPPLALALPLLALAIAVPVLDAVCGAMAARFPTPPRTAAHRFRLRALTAALSVAQPVARVVGRLRNGSGLLRRRRGLQLRLPPPLSTKRWEVQWVDAIERVHGLQQAINDAGLVTVRGSEWDRWDLAIRGGLLGGVRVLVAVEDHGGGNQLVRVRWWPRVSTISACVAAGFCGLSALAIADGQAAMGAVLAGVAAALAATALADCAVAAQGLGEALDASSSSQE